jgi:hypothetical protein
MPPGILRITQQIVGTSKKDCVGRARNAIIAGVIEHVRRFALATVGRTENRYPIR